MLDEVVEQLELSTITVLPVKILVGCIKLKVLLSWVTYMKCTSSGTVFSVDIGGNMSLIPRVHDWVALPAIAIPLLTLLGSTGESPLLELMMRQYFY